MYHYCAETNNYTWLRVVIINLSTTVKTHTDYIVLIILINIIFVLVATHYEQEDSSLMLHRLGLIFIWALVK